MFADFWVAPTSYGDDCVLLLLILVITFSELSRVLSFFSLVDATVVLADGVPLYDFADMFPLLALQQTSYLAQGCSCW